MSTLSKHRDLVAHLYSHQVAVHRPTITHTIVHITGAVVTCATATEGETKGENEKEVIAELVGRDQ